MCECSAAAHHVYEFASTRAKEAYANVTKLFEDYLIDTTLQASVDDTEKMGVARNDFTYGEVSFLSFPSLLALANPKVISFGTHYIAWRSLL